MRNDLSSLLKMSSISIKVAPPKVCLTSALKLVTQEKTNWCWVSVAIGTASYLKSLLVKEQCRLVGLVTGCFDCDDPECNKTGSVRKALAEQGIDARQVDAIPDFDDLFGEIKDDRPVVCDMRDDDFGFHSVVVRCCSSADRMVDMLDPATDRSINFFGRWEESSLNYDIIAGDFERHFLVTDPRRS
jgi:hypothetical protein